MLLWFILCELPPQLNASFIGKEGCNCVSPVDKVFEVVKLFDLDAGPHDLVMELVNRQHIFPIHVLRNVGEQLVWTATHKTGHVVWLYKRAMSCYCIQDSYFFLGMKKTK